MRAFVGGARDPQALERSDAELVATVAGGAAPAARHRAASRCSTRVYRWERANAQHEVGHLDAWRRSTARWRAIPGLFVTGSGFRGVGIPDCVADARRTARCGAWLAQGRGTEKEK